jgi:hypothetical protein
LDCKGFADPPKSPCKEAVSKKEKKNFCSSVKTDWTWSNIFRPSTQGLKIDFHDITITNSTSSEICENIDAYKSTVMKQSLQQKFVICGYGVGCIKPEGGEDLGRKYCSWEKEAGRTRRITEQ